MDREQTIDHLKMQEAELRRSGLEALYIFGSVARGENGPKSDIDLACDIDKNAKIGLFEFADIMIRLEEQLNRKVDLVTLEAMRPRIRARAERDMVKVF